LTHQESHSFPEDPDNCDLKEILLKLDGKIICEMRHSQWLMDQYDAIKMDSNARNVLKEIKSKKIIWRFTDYTRTFTLII
jgi:hypothetical protein